MPLNKETKPNPFQTDKSFLLSFASLAPRLQVAYIVSAHDTI